MIKETNFKHVQTISHADKGFLWEINLDEGISQLPIGLLISLTRPKVNEDQIRKNVTYRYQEKLKDSLFSEEIRAQIEVEAKQEIELAWKKTREMARPVIFAAHVSEYKDQTRKIVLRVDKSVGLYLFKNGEKIETLLLTLDQYPQYLTGKEEVEKIVSDFREANEDYLDTKTLLD